MLPTAYRKSLIFPCIVVAFAASVTYDTLFAITAGRLRLILVAVLLGSLGTAFILERYPQRILSKLVSASWPLHLFSCFFVYECLAFHNGYRVGQVVAYTIVAYASYLFLPLLLLLDRRRFDAFVVMIATFSGVLAIPSFVGALGYTSLLGVRLSSKPFYADFSGIIASGGVFEHGEGHALQMAAGMLCCVYLLRKGPRGNLARYLLVASLVLSSGGLIISQGRAAIFGIAIAIAFTVLPGFFRSVRPVFLGAVAVALLFPFFIWPNLGAVPGLGRYLRIERGLSGRTEAWQFAVLLVRDKPWTGHGFLASADLTAANEQRLRRNTGYTGAGTTFHNTFVSKAVDLGLIATGLYCLLYVAPFLRICDQSDYPLEQHLVRCMILLTLTTAIFRDYNIGGVRSTSIMGTTFLGITNLWPLTSTLWRRPPVVDPAIEPKSNPGFVTENAT